MKLDARSLMNRDWGLPERVQDEQYAAMVRAGRWAELLAEMDELNELGRCMQPDWPGPEEREQDYRTHVRVSEMLARVSHIDWAKRLGVIKPESPRPRRR